MTTLAVSWLCYTV